MNRIIYIDYTSHGVIHEIYNSSSAEMLSIIFDRVDYYASKDSIEVCKKMFKTIPENIYFHKLFVPNPDKSKINLFLFYFLPILGSIYFLLKAMKNDVIFFNSNPPWAFPFINKIACLIKNKIIIVFHGELEILIDKKKKLNRFSHYSIMLLKKNKFKISKNLFICCLGEGIKNRLLLLVTEDKKKQIIYFEHTAIFNNFVVNKTPNKNNIKIGITGTVHPLKSSINDLLEFAKKIKHIHNVEIYVIGRVYCDPIILENMGINYINGAQNKSLSRIQIDSIISEMDYLVYLYQFGSNQLTASGAVFDAINAEKYILALKNDYFIDLFDNRVNAGSLFNSFDDIINFISIQGKNPPILNYHQIKNILSPQFEAPLFMNRLKEKHIID